VCFCYKLLGIIGAGVTDTPQSLAFVISFWGLGRDDDPFRRFENEAQQQK
jgi:hypothetical protein